MTNSDFENFKKDLFKNLKKESKKSLTIIEQNHKLIESYLFNKDLPQVKEFVNEFNDIVLDKKIKEYKLFEDVLKERTFADVLARFRESDVLVRICKMEFQKAENFNITSVENKKVIDWLLTMDINYGVQDELGMTALMYSVRHKILDFVVEKIMSTNGKHITFTNSKGNNALFFASLNRKNLKRFFKYKEYFDINHLNNNDENVILFACRFGELNTEEHVFLLNKLNCSYPNITNRDGLTAAMYLVKRCKYIAMESFVKDNNIDPNYRNKFDNCLVSVFIQEYYNHFNKCIGDKDGFGLNLDQFKHFGLTLKKLIALGCDFHVPVDEDGNTTATILTKMKDDLSIQELLESNAIDFAVDNKCDKNNRYNEVDISNKTIKTNLESIRKWLKEVYNTKNTINADVVGVLLHGHNYSMY